MLRELRIENLLLIERAELRLEPGLNAITGETGAGKTVLAHALDLLMGGRARPQIVRPGAGEAWIEGVFDLPPGLLSAPELGELTARLPGDADELVLGRRVGATGRTSAFVAGRSATAADLGLLGSRLLAFYGQHEHRRLTLSSAQLEVLDGFIGAEHLGRRAAYRKDHVEIGQLERELEELFERDGARERDLDLYRYELAEIEAAAPDPAEEADLAAERERLRHVEGRRAAAAGSLAALVGPDEEGGGAAEAAAAARAALQAVDGVDTELDEVAARVDGLAEALSESGRELRSYLEGLDSDPARLEEVEERLGALDRLKRKHGGSLESVLAHAERCRAEIERLEGAEERGTEVEQALATARERRASLASGLSAARTEAAGALEERVAAELEQLAMPGARIEVVLDPHPQGFGAAGSESVELRVATNPGLQPAPLRDAASGGELSRVMLALTGLAAGAGASTLVFDEIDAGIGGNTARAVGERLRGLAEGRQVICITHLPQVASAAGANFRITKAVSQGESLASVERVDGEELVAEICRMLGADRADEAASRHARQLLAAA